jgi:hypothetical protein
MDNDLLHALLEEVSRPVARYSWLESYYNGNQPNGYLTREQREALGERLSHLSVNIPKLAITSLAERLTVTGFTGVDVWPDWQRLDFDQLQDVVHREALALGESYVCVWQRDGKPFATVESSWQMGIIRDPGTREVTAAIKKWDTDKTTEATVFTPDKIFKLRANTTHASTANSFHVYETLDNPLGVVPVVVFVNSDRFAEHGVSEIDDLADLVDGLNLALADLAIAQAFEARPKIAVTGQPLEEKPVLDTDGNPVLDGNGDPVMSVESPIPPNDRVIVVESEQARVTQLNGSDLAGFEAAVRIWLSAIQAVSALPASYLGILSDQPTSADSLRAAEASLAARAQNRAGMFGRSWEQVARLLYVVANPGTDVSEVDVRVQWADFATRSFAQQADGIVKLYTAGLVSRSGALAMLGWTADQIEAERAAVRAESLDRQGLGIRLTGTPNVSQNGPQPEELAS